MICYFCCSLESKARWRSGSWVPFRQQNKRKIKGNKGEGDAGEEDHKWVSFGSCLVVENCRGLRMPLVVWVWSKVCSPERLELGTGNSGSYFDVGGA